MTTYTNIPILAPGRFTAMDGRAAEFNEVDLLSLEADMARRETAGRAAPRGGVPLNLEHAQFGGAGPRARHEDAGRDARATATNSQGGAGAAQSAAEVAATGSFNQTAAEVAATGTAGATGRRPHPDADTAVRATEETGRASNIRYDPLRRQLLADLQVTDRALDAAIQAGRYQGRSAELEITTSGAGGPARRQEADTAVRATGRGIRLTGLALLDQLRPAVPGLGGLGKGLEGRRPAAPGADRTSALQAGAGDAWRRPYQITRKARKARHNITIYGGSE